MRVVIDAMGGDGAPRVPVEGAVRAATEERLAVTLVGIEEEILRELGRLQVSADVAHLLRVVHADEVVEMDEPATTPIRKKRNSSIRIAAQLVRDGEADALISAGNTGAVMIAAKMVIGVAPGVDRPALAASIPHRSGWTILLDVGANVDSRAEHLRQFAVMGHFYATMLGLPRPRVALLSIGEEAGKGTDVTREVFQTLETAGLHFIGNVEGGDIFRGTADVIVCDGFVGNVVLKSAEALSDMMFSAIREEIAKSPLTRLGGGLAKPAMMRFRRRVSYDEIGGAPLLGLRAGCFISHGSSNAKALKNGIVRAAEFAREAIPERISEHLSQQHLTPAATGREAAS